MGAAENDTLNRVLSSTGWGGGFEASMLASMDMACHSVTCHALAVCRGWIQSLLAGGIGVLKICPERVDPVRRAVPGGTNQYY